MPTALQQLPPAPVKPAPRASLSRAALEGALSLIRSWGLGPRHPDWQARAEICARCPIATREKSGDGGGDLTCGRPLLHQLHRRAEQGCGCPVNAKAKDPAEHCPVDGTLTETHPRDGVCNCKWCAGAGLAKAA